MGKVLFSLTALFCLRTPGVPKKDTHTKVKLFDKLFPEHCSKPKKNGHIFQHHVHNNITLFKTEWQVRSNVNICNYQIIF